VKEVIWVDSGPADSDKIGKKEFKMLDPFSGLDSNV